MRLQLVFIAIAAACVFDSVAKADLPSRTATGNAPSVYDLPKAVAIQPRKYEMKNSIVGTIGYIPTDSFNRGYTFTGAYRYGFASSFIWEVFSFTYVLNQETQLKNQIEGIAQGNSTVNIQNVGLGGVLDYPRQIYMTGIHYSPLYSKNLLLNSKLSYSEFSFFLGTGSLNFNATGYKPMIAPGVNLRFYLSSNYAFNAYFRDYLFDDSNTGVTGIMDFGIGFEMRFGGEKSHGLERPPGEARDDI